VKHWAISTLLLLGVVALLQGQSKAEQLAALQTISSSDDLRLLYSYYGDKPRPDLLGSSIDYVASQRLCSNPSFEDRAIFFYGPVFSQMGDLSPYFGSRSKFGPNEQIVFSEVLHFANTKESLALMNDIIAHCDSSAKDYLNRLKNLPPIEVMKIPVKSPETLDVLWQGFFAAHEPKYVLRIAKALEKNMSDISSIMLAGAARQSLQANAVDYPVIRTILKENEGIFSESAREDVETIANGGQ